MELIGELITVTTGYPSPWLYRSRLPRVSVKEEDIKQIKQTQQQKDYRPISTLHLKSRNDHNFPARVVSTTLMAPEYHELKPKELNRGPIPVHNIWREHSYILPRAMFPVMLQQASYFVFPGYQWPIWMAYTIYFFSFAEFLLGTVRRLESFALLYGTFDERKIGRDRTPDYSIPQLCRAFLAFLILRTAGEFILKWDSSEQPFSNFNITTLPRMFIWLIVMDYFFYVWHRSSHQVPWLWKLHQEHHTTKHPSPALSILAEGPQEIIEILIVPLCATLLIPLTFHELFVLMCYTSYVEIFGHTGIRADWKLPITGFILQPFGLELMGEDHDLHHRYGKSGKNYGKQSRVWDVLFGTTGDREECANLPGHRPL